MNFHAWSNFLNILFKKRDKTVCFSHVDSSFNLKKGIIIAYKYLQMGNTVPFDVSAPLLSLHLLLHTEMPEWFAQLCQVKNIFLMYQTGDYELL